jgi:hypothetical protein
VTSPEAVLTEVTSSEGITNQLSFLPYFPYLFTIQLTFLPYFPNLSTIQLTFFPKQTPFRVMSHPVAMSVINMEEKSVE